MDTSREVVVLSGARTAIGDYGGAFKDVAPTVLAATVVREALKRSRVDPAEVAQLVFGNVIHTEPRDMYLSRVACIKAGLPQETVALTLNRLCGSGLQAVVSAAQSIATGDCDVAVAGGAESMSRAGHILPTLRWGQRMADGGVIDMMVGALTDPFETVHMGITAENIAERWKISREEQDAFAVESHRARGVKPLARLLAFSVTREWRGSRVGASDRSNRLRSYGQGARRAATHRRPVRARHDVHRRRAGHRGHLRARSLTISTIGMLRHKKVVRGC